MQASHSLNGKRVDVKKAVGRSEMPKSKRGGGDSWGGGGGGRDSWSAGGGRDSWGGGGRDSWGGGGYGKYFVFHLFGKFFENVFCTFSIVCDQINCEILPKRFLLFHLYT